MAADEERLRVEKEIDVLNDLLATASGAGGGIEEEELAVAAVAPCWDPRPI